MGVGQYPYASPSPTTNVGFSYAYMIKTLEGYSSLVYCAPL